MIGVELSISDKGIEIKNIDLKTIRDGKGKSLLEMRGDFVLVDIETTGLMTGIDDIIEISAIRVTNNQVKEKFSKLVKPREKVSEFIEKLTGITNDMLKEAEKPKKALKDFLDFVKPDDVLVGYNVNFDINFLYDDIQYYLKKNFGNDYIDVMRFSKILLKEKIERFRLKDLSYYYGIDYSKAHRGLEDCRITWEVLKKLKEEAEKQYGSIEKFLEYRKNVTRGKIYNLNNIRTDNTVFDEEHPFFKKHFCFTGKLEKMKRTEAAQIVVDLGGIAENSVTAKTNFLVLGNNDYCSSIKDGKSSKHKKAEKLKLEGNDIEVISEKVFYDMI